MKTLLDLLTELLPEGAELRNAKETSSRFHFDFVYEGGVSKGNMFKVCALGYEERFVTQEIASHMASILLDKGDVDGAKMWLNVSSTGKMPEKEEKKCTD